MTTDFYKLVALCREERFDDLEKSLEDINIQDENANTLLIECCLHGYDNAVRYLVSTATINNLRTPLDINRCNKDEDTALHICILKRRLDMIKYLVESCPDIDIEKENGFGSALGYACSLLYEDNSSLIDIIKYLIEIGANINTSDGQGRTPLYDACMTKNLDLIKLLLDKGANKYSGDMIYGNLFGNIIHEINMETINTQEITYKEVLKFLFDNMNISNIDIDIFNMKFNIGNDILYVSFHDYRFVGTIKILFDCGIITDINKQNSKGDTLLHCACKFMNIDMIKYLLDKGTTRTPVLDKYIENKEGKTPMDLVREFHDKEKAEEILDLMFPPDRCKFIKGASK